MKHIDQNEQKNGRKEKISKKNNFEVLGTEKNVAFYFECNYSNLFEKDTH